MIVFLKRNKIFTILVCITVVTSLIGLLLPSVIKEDTKKEITENIITLKEDLQNQEITKEKIKTLPLENLLTITFIWLLGISVIGIPILCIIYMTKVLLISSELTFLLINIKNFKILWIPIYLIPQIIKIIIDFILVYYAIQYSVFLIKLLFFQKEYVRTRITIRYLKILAISSILIILNSLIEIYLVPLLLKISS